METKNSNLQGLGILASVPIISTGTGCTDSTAFNYDPAATTDDGSCVAIILGCTDAAADHNYDASANTDDGSCGYDGCTDPTATNYQQYYTHDDNSCTYSIPGCTDGSVDNNNVPIYYNYDANATVDDGSCVAAVYGCTDDNFDSYDSSANVNQVSSIDTSNPCYNVVYGCITPNHCNYVGLQPPYAQQGAGVFHICVKCDQPGANNFDGYEPIDPSDPGATPVPLANCGTWCETCKPVDNLTVMNTTSTSIDIQWTETFQTPSAAPVDYYEVEYSTDPTNLGWTTVNGGLPSVSTQGTVSYTIAGLAASTSYSVRVRVKCQAGTASHPNQIAHFTYSGYTPTAMTTTMQAQIQGCTDFNACNYNIAATQDDGSCEMPNACMDPLYLEYNAGGTCNNQSMCLTLIVNGCTDPSSSNYDASANVDDGSCCVDGCTDPTASNFNNLATCDDGSCIAVVNGCTDSTACNYDATATVDDGSCTGLLGCTDATMINYNANATCDDGSCYSNAINGCTDPAATNYDPLANVDDGSCFAINGSIVSFLSNTPGGYFNVTTGTPNVINHNLTWDFPLLTAGSTNLMPNGYEIKHMPVSGNGVIGDFTATNFAGNLIASTQFVLPTEDNNGNTALNQSHVFDNTTYFSPPTHIHYRVRWITTYNQTQYYGPWVDAWGIQQ